MKSICAVVDNSQIISRLVLNGISTIFICFSTRILMFNSVQKYVCVLLTNINFFGKKNSMTDLSIHMIESSSYG